MGNRGSNVGSLTAGCLLCGERCHMEGVLKHRCPPCCFCGQPVRIADSGLPYPCQNRNLEVLCKVMLIGPPDTGAKSSFLFRVLRGYYKESFRATIGVDFGMFETGFDGAPVRMKLQFWDVSGRKRFSSMVRVYFRDADIAILSCDITRKSSLLELDQWIDVLLENSPEARVIMVANKQDLLTDSKATKLFAIEADAFVARRSEVVMGWFPMSVKTGFNVGKLMDQLTLHLADKKLTASGNGFSALRERAQKAAILIIMARKFSSRNTCCPFTWLPKEIGDCFSLF